MNDAEYDASLALLRWFEEAPPPKCPRCGCATEGWDIDGTPERCDVCAEITMLAAGEHPEVAHGLPELKRKIREEVFASLRILVTETHPPADPEGD